MRPGVIRALNLGASVLAQNDQEIGESSGNSSACGSTPSPGRRRSPPAVSSAGHEELRLVPSSICQILSRRTVRLWPGVDTRRDRQLSGFVVGRLPHHRR